MSAKDVYVPGQPIFEAAGDPVQQPPEARNVVPGVPVTQPPPPTPDASQEAARALFSTPVLRAARVETPSPPPPPPMICVGSFFGAPAGAEARKDWLTVTGEQAPKQSPPVPPAEGGTTT
jgi:hypothetical protein